MTQNKNQSEKKDLEYLGTSNPRKKENSQDLYEELNIISFEYSLEKLNSFYKTEDSKFNLESRKSA